MLLDRRRFLARGNLCRFFYHYLLICKYTVVPGFSESYEMVVRSAKRSCSPRPGCPKVGSDQTTRLGRQPWIYYHLPSPPSCRPFSPSCGAKSSPLFPTSSPAC